MPLISLLGNPRVMLLACAQALVIGASTVMVAIGPIVGLELIQSSPGGNNKLATLPMALMFIGISLSALPAGYLSNRFSRRIAFQCGALIGIAGALVAALALTYSSFLIFCAGSTLLGMANGFGQQYRFVAADSLPSDRAPYAVSLVLIGAVGGAALGPWLSSIKPWWDGWVGVEGYQAALVLASGCYVVVLALVSGLRTPKVPVVEAVEAAPEAASEAETGHSVLDVISRPVVIVAILAGVVSYAVMTFLMTATPIAMTEVEGFSRGDAASAVAEHTMLMYLPSLFTGTLISMLGVRWVLLLGAGISVAVLIPGMAQDAFFHYWLALALLGVGWNFMFTGGTTLLVTSLTGKDRIRVQMINDFCMFGIAAAASLVAGIVVLTLGWTAALLMTLGPLALLIIAVLVVLKPERATAPD